MQGDRWVCLEQGRGKTVKKIACSFVFWRIGLFNKLYKNTQWNIKRHCGGFIIASCLCEQYLDSSVKRRSIFLFEAVSDIQHVHLTPWDHYPHQGAVISSSTLNIFGKRGFFFRMSALKTQLGLFSCQRSIPVSWDLITSYVY